MRRAIALIDRSDVVLFCGSYIVLVVVWYGLGRAIMASDVIMRADYNAVQWLVRRRTPRLDYLTELGSSMSSTGIKILVTAVLAAVVFAVWRRWREPMVIVLSLLLEAMAFITVTYLVARPRPDVARLEGSSVDSSFPSGHAAAAVVYSAVLIVVFWHTRKWWVRIIAGIVTLSVAVIVAVSRVYRGMHYLTDVIAGCLLGAASVVCCWWLIDRVLRRTEDSHSGRGDTVAESLGDLDLSHPQPGLQATS